MKNFFKNNFIIIIFLLTVIFAIVVLIAGSKVPTPSPQPLPIIQASPKPISPSRQEQQKLLSTNIRGQTFQVIDPLLLNFSQPQATPSVTIRIDPPTAVVLKQLTPTSIAIEPEQVWQFNKIYKVTVGVFGQEYSFSFQTEERRGI